MQMGGGRMKLLLDFKETVIRKDSGGKCRHRWVGQVGSVVQHSGSEGSWRNKTTEINNLSTQGMKKRKMLLIKDKRMRI